MSTTLDSTESCGTELNPSFGLVCVRIRQDCCTHSTVISYLVVWDHISPERFLYLTFTLEIETTYRTGKTDLTLKSYLFV